MNFLSAIGDGFASCLKFGSKWNRAQFWKFASVGFLFPWIFTALFDAFADNVVPYGYRHYFSNELNMLVLAVLHLPIVSAIIRRLRDTGPTAKRWLIFIFVMVIAALFLFTITPFALLFMAGGHKEFMFAVLAVSAGALLVVLLLPSK